MIADAYSVRSASMGSVASRSESSDSMIVRPVWVPLSPKRKPALESSSVGSRSAIWGRMALTFAQGCIGVKILAGKQFAFPLFLAKRLISEYSLILAMNNDLATRLARKRSDGVTYCNLSRDMLCSVK